MKKSIFLTILLCSLYLGISAQQKAEDIIGYYLVEDPFIKEKSQIHIYKAGNGKYEAKVVWVENPEKKHHIGLLFLYDLEYDKDKNEWNKGRVKYPGKSGTYRINMSFSDSKTMKVRGYWGVSMFGMTLYWSKEDKARC
ncbi:DUF2147 domain-containing protein [Bacteroidales bacterium OttesenSCG-928-B11]|nr:DUF2147 domain-containing protein [Bacteroidales bacterium OttesenSCG-928-E04]MDL2312903.1 DUF2147 domain-containing protein [Bacteroidales bacterium OttesenSCG-928-B11]MDL2326387.1 DUF2147 domain-containing protein [Bacteroidales bacterium OttesenSCG-928-A14]